MAMADWWYTLVEGSLGSVVFSKLSRILHLRVSFDGRKMALRKVTLGRSNFLTRILPFDGFFLVSSPEEVGS